jgi:hypothetical protein
MTIGTLWLKPVTVKRQNGLPHTFNTLEDSLDFLEHEWPVRYGVHHRRAIDLCRSAMQRRVAVEAAREAFIGACFEAGMPLVIHGTAPVCGVAPNAGASA